MTFSFYLLAAFLLLPLKAFEKEKNYLAGPIFFAGEWGVRKKNAVASVAARSCGVIRDQNCRRKSIPNASGARITPRRFGHPRREEASDKYRD
jgi:hypothetical protein